MNIDALIAAAKRPLPFEPSARNIWTDPWIAKGMLAAHLDDSTDAASRAPAQRARAIRWIEGLLEGQTPGRRPRVLDLGCGPGLYAEELAARGYEVAGVDLSPSSVDYARSSAAEKGLDIEYRRGNYLTDELGGGYELALMIYCDFGALAPAASELILDRLRGALAPGGLFVFDVVGPGLASTAPRRAWSASAGPGFWSPGPHLLLEETFVYPERRCLARQHLLLAEGEEPALYRSWDRWFDVAEIRRMLGDRGFEAIEIRGDLVAKNDFGPEDVLFVAARRLD